MRITLNQDELEKAVMSYINSQITIENKDVSIDFTAGRGDKGISVDIDITDPVIKGTVKEAEPAFSEGNEESDGEDNSLFG
jgi:hypothetical protein